MLLASFYQQNWNEAKKDFILCEMQSRQRLYESSECMIQDKDRQSIGWTYVHLFAFLTPNLLIYMWVYQSVLKYWTGASHNILQGLLTMLKSNGQPNSKGTLGKSQIVRKAF